ncbi:MAG: siphovirus Gp157 family protein [Pseudomonadota bacterium]
MSKLYEIAAKMEAAIKDMENNGFDAETIQATLDGIDVGLDEKVESTVAVIKNMQGNSDLYANEIRRLQALKKTSDNKANGLLEYLAFNIERAGVKSAGIGIHTAKFKTSNRVAVDVDVESLPIEYTTIKVTANKNEIKQGLASGDLCPSMAHIETIDNLFIK